MNKKYLFLLILPVLFLIPKNTFAASEISYGSGQQWVFTGTTEATSINSNFDWSSGTVNGGESTFGNWYLISKANVSISGGPSFYYGPRMLLVRLLDVNIQANTTYHVEVKLSYDNAMIVRQGNINSLLNQSVVLVNGSWSSSISSINAIVSTKQIDFYFSSSANATAVSLQIGNPYDSSTTWTSFYNPLDTVDMTFGVTSVKIYQDNDTSGLLNGIQSGISSTNEKLDNAEETRKGIWETIKGLPSKFLDMLKGLFIPDNFDFLDNFKESLENKLGFIAEVPLAVLDFISGLATASWEGFNSITLPTIEIFGVNFWNSQEVSLQEAINIFSPYKYVTDVICVVLCVNTLRKWYDKFASGGGDS